MDNKVWYAITAIGHNGDGDGGSFKVFTTLQGAKSIATRDSAGDRCHITITQNGSPVANRDARDSFRGCCNGGWGPWYSEEVA